MDAEELEHSDPFPSDPNQLKRKLRQQGYLFFRDVIEKSVLTDLRGEFLSILAREGWLAANTHPMEGITDAMPVVEGEEAFFEVYDEIQKLESFHGLAHNQALMNIMKLSVSPTAFPHPLAVARLVFPDNIECTTPPHQDYANNQGTKNLYASWIPLGDCPRELGGISVLESSPDMGLLPLEFSLGAGGRQARLPADTGGRRWLTADFQCGDVLIFGSLTVHRSLPNLSGNRFRLSVDFRYQEEYEPLTATVLEPHFGRLSWDAIYRDWKETGLQYYWEKKNFEVAPWDDSLHELPASHLRDAIRQSRRHNRHRQERDRKRHSNN